MAYRQQQILLLLMEVQATLKTLISLTKVMESTRISSSVANATIHAQYVSAVNNLRSGKGAIFVKSSGNGYTRVRYGDWYYFCDTLWGFSTGLTCQNATADPTNAMPENIVVGALQATGVKSTYSTSGAALWVSAPGGEYGWTTTQQ